MKSICNKMLGIALICLLSACASTPQSRIKKNQEVFDSFPADVQEKIKAGEVAIGFAQEMVLMAKDKPDRKYARKTPKGELEVWSYSGFYTTTDHRRVEARIHAPDVGGNWRYYNDWVWVDVEHQHEYEQFRVEFEDGKVSAFETLTK